MKPSRPRKGQARSLPASRALPPASELERLARVAKYSPRTFTDLCGYSRNAWQLRRLFHRSFGYSLRSWLQRVRISEARVRLLQGETPKGLLAELGFVDLSHLSHSFKRIHGDSPTQFLDSTGG